MKLIYLAAAAFIALGAQPSFSMWEAGNPTPPGGLNNPYNLNEDELKEATARGKIHALVYPVSVTGLLVPYAPLKKSLDNKTRNPIMKLINGVFKRMAGVESFDDLNSWLGLQKFPDSQTQNDPTDELYFIPEVFKANEDRMGLSFVQKNGGTGFTYSCATCHASNLFGKKVLGLTNRFSRANDFFILGKKALSAAPTTAFALATGATKLETQMYRRSKKNIQFVEAIPPSQYGQDTSLAHVALSLSHREKDAYATKSDRFKKTPRPDKLRNMPVDSKPGVWWTVKYKNRWLLDGSVVSGNPIVTNLLWNEIGRGTDLKELEAWIENNEQTIKELTTVVFNNQAPHMTDFFDADNFDLNKAKLGQELFNGKCANCHGKYYKAWDLPTAELVDLTEQLKTVSVDYPEQTQIRNVGTDSFRARGMSSLVQLNDLALSKKFGVKIKPSRGYVPPPLVGIWARWPYLHNNSVPNLCALFTEPSQRPVTYYSGEANNPYTDFDFDCNGYPLGNNTPEGWKTREHLFDTNVQGSSNKGHYKKIFQTVAGEEIFTSEEKKAMIHFLQTL